MISDAEAGDVTELRAMFREYAALIGDDFWSDGFEDELAALPEHYDALLVARDESGALVGSVAVKRLPDGTAELKRLYVRPPARGTGLGRTLAAAAVERARELGYTLLRLDTLPRWRRRAPSTPRSGSGSASRTATTRFPASSSSSCASKAVCAAK